MERPRTVRPQLRRDSLGRTIQVHARGKSLMDASNFVALLGDLHSRDVKTRKRAAIDLGRQKELRAVEPLIGLLTDSAARREATDALVKIGDGAVPALCEAVKHREPTVSLSAIEALGRIRDRRAVEPLLVLLQRSDPRTRREAALALGRIRDARAVEELILLLQEPEAATRSTVAEALARIGDSRAVGPLAALLEEEEFLPAVAEALGRIGDAQAVGPLVTTLCTDPDNRAVIWGALARIGAGSVSALIGMLSHRYSRIRRNAATTLGEIRDPAAVESLLVVLQDEDYVAAAAARALGCIGDKRGEPALLVRLPVADDARISVIEALGKIGGSAAIGPLIRLARVSPGESDVAVRALTQILTRAAAEITDDDLTRITQVNGIPMKTMEYSYHDDQYGAVYDHGMVFTSSYDLSQLKELARAELARGAQ